MGLFDWLKKDPSSQWPLKRRIDRTLDLRTARWAGVALGDPARTLRSLGRPSNRKPFSQGMFEYRPEGFCVEIDRDRVEAFGLVVGATDWDASYTPHPVRVIWPDGSETVVDHATDHACFTEHLGTPIDRDQDEQEIVQRYDRQTHQLELEAALDRAVRRINLWRNFESEDP